MNQTARRISFWKNFGKPPGRKFRTRTLKGNKTMKTTTSFTYPAFALFVFACFALSPQAFAQVGPVRFTPATAPNCSHSVSVTLSSTTSGATILYYLSGGAGQNVPNPTTIRVPKAPGSLGTATVQAMAWKTGMTNSGWTSATYTYHCSGPSPKAKIVLLVIGLILLAAVLIWLFKKRSSANR